MAKLRMTSGLIADAALGGDGISPNIGAGQASYAEAILSIEKHCAVIGKLIECGQFLSLSVEADSIAKIAAELCRLALEDESGVPLSGIGEIVQKAQQLSSVCAALAVISKSGGGDFAGKRLEELNVLVASLKKFVKPAS